MFNHGNQQEESLQVVEESRNAGVNFPKPTQFNKRAFLPPPPRQQNILLSRALASLILNAQVFTETGCIIFCVHLSEFLFSGFFPSDSMCMCVRIRVHIQGMNDTKDVLQIFSKTAQKRVFPVFAR